MIYEGNIMNTITLDYLLKHEFQKTGLETYTNEKKNASMRFTKKQLSSLPPNDSEKMSDLKSIMSDIYYEKGLLPAKFEILTNIKYNSFKKSVNSINSRNRRISRETLAKFVVGLGIDYEQANKMFKLESQPLSPEHILLDAVVVHCIQNEYDINEMFETCKQVNLDLTFIE